MDQEHQKTIGKSVTLSGRGLFSGEPATVTLSPAEPNEGITFVREQEQNRWVDLAGIPLGRSLVRP